MRIEPGHVKKVAFLNHCPVRSFSDEKFDHPCSRSPRRAASKMLPRDGLDSGMRFRVISLENRSLIRHKIELKGASFSPTNWVSGLLLALSMLVTLPLASPGRSIRGVQE